MKVYFYSWGLERFRQEYKHCESKRFTTKEKAEAHKKLFEKRGHVFPILNVTVYDVQSEEVG